MEIYFTAEHEAPEVTAASLVSLVSLAGAGLYAPLLHHGSK